MGRRGLRSRAGAAIGALALAFGLIAAPTSAATPMPVVAANGLPAGLHIGPGVALRPGATVEPAASSTADEHRAVEPRVDSRARTAPTAAQPADGGSTPPDPVPYTPTSAPPVALPGFQGLAEGGPNTTSEPPDPWLAVGPNDLIQVVNSAVRITDRSGAPRLADIPMGTFFAAPYPDVATAHIVFDARHGVWIGTELSYSCSGGTDDDHDGSPAAFGHSSIDLAVSTSIDPTRPWRTYHVVSDDVLADYPGLGLSTDKLAFSADQYPFTGPGCTFGPDGGGILGVADLDTLVGAHVLVYHEMGGSSVELYRVANQVPATSEVLDVIGIGTGAAPSNVAEGVAYFRFSGPVTLETLPNPDAFDLTALGISQSFSLPPPPRQPGSPATIAEAVDDRATDALWQGGRLVFVSTYPCVPSGDLSTRDCVRVTELDTRLVTSVTPPTEVQDMLVGENGEDLYLGGIGLSGDGTLHVVFSRSSSAPGDGPSIEAAYQRRTDGAGSLSVPAPIETSAATYGGSRWGGYVGVAQDPQVPSAVWQADEYANADGGWSTFVNQLQTGGTTYVPITPLRIVDSRDGSGLSGLAGKFSAGQARSFAVAGLGGVNGIAPDAVAVTGNLTVTNQTKPGFLALTPDPTDTPGSSTLNFPVGDNRANNVTIPLNATGQLAAVYKASPGATADVVFDVTGFFVAGTGQATYVPISPTRVLDTRTTSRLVASSPLVVPVGLPSDAIAVTANLTVVNQTRAGFLAVTPTADPNPATSTLNFPAGDIRANGLAVSLSSGSLAIVYKAVAGATTDVALDITGYFTTKPATGLAFYPLNPSRIMDSRGAPRSLLTGPFKSSTPRSLPVTGEWGVPAGAAAVTGNLTVVGQTSAGFVAATDAALPNPSLPPSTCRSATSGRTGSRPGSTARARAGSCSRARRQPGRPTWSWT